MGGGGVKKLKAVFVTFVLLFGLTFSSCSSCKKKDEPENKTNATGAEDSNTPYPTPTLQTPSTPPIPTPKKTPKQVAEVEVRTAIKRVADAVKNVNEKAKVAGTEEEKLAKTLLDKAILKPGPFSSSTLKTTCDEWIALVNKWANDRDALTKSAERVIAGDDIKSWDAALVAANSTANTKDENTIDEAWKGEKYGIVVNRGWCGTRGWILKTYPNEFANVNAVVVNFYAAKAELNSAIDELKNAMTKWISA